MNLLLIFKNKANYLNKFFNQQCTVTTIKFDEQLASKLIVALNPNKAHGHDGLSIRMFQIVSDSLNPSQPELPESRLLPDSMEEGQCCPCPQKKETNKI